MVATILNRATPRPQLFLAPVSTVLWAQESLEVATTVPFLASPTLQELAEENAQWNAVFERKSQTLEALAEAAREAVRKGEVTPLRVSSP